MKHHPEQLSDEVFLGNATEKTYQRHGWKTKRRGKTAYMADGSEMGLNDMAYLKPVFVKRSEIEEALLIETDYHRRRFYRKLLDNGRISLDDKPE